MPLPSTRLLDQWVADGYREAQKDLRNLLRKTRDHTPSARVAAVIAWAGDDLEQMDELLPEPVPWSLAEAEAVRSTWKANARRPGCSYSVDECPFDWCAVHDEVPSASTTYYCTPTCVVGHERQDGRCGR
jgi:hypothetical protein